MEIIHQPNIGFIYDVCQVIICKTAKRENWINTFVMNGQEEQDIQQIDQILKRFSAIAQHWNILTSTHQKKGILLTKLYIEFLHNTVCTAKENNFAEYISTPNLLRNKVCDWYFETNHLSETACFNNLLKDDELEDNVKLKLYEFFTSPEEYTLILTNSIQKVSSEMEKFYRKNEIRLKERQNSFKYFDFQ